ncbi:hypothetical protein ABIA32_002620 [Streptacidiphilus sp. MAP12-20]|uniref:hypothetical protein n=1 Tax=Streptacidiphilus sp. MAP12-20 TaxID=3156299 RepID=UPI003513FA29
MEFRHHPRRSMRVLSTFVALVAAGTAGLAACSSGTATGSPSAVPSPGPTSSLITPGGPILSPSPGPSSSTTPQPGSPSAGQTPRGFPASGYSAAGTVLTVYFTAGVCDKYGVTADQSQPGKVLVTVVVTQHPPTGQMCPLVITPQHASVDLGRPLDGREVVDTATGKALPPQHAWTSGMESHGPVGKN